MSQQDKTIPPSGSCDCCDCWAHIVLYVSPTLERDDVVRVDRRQQVRCSWCISQLWQARRDDAAAIR